MLWDSIYHFLPFIIVTYLQTLTPLLKCTFSQLDFAQNLAHVWLVVSNSCDPRDYSPPGSSLSMVFSRQEYWSGLPFPSPGNPLDPGIEPGSPALQVVDLLTEL